MELKGSHLLYLVLPEESRNHYMTNINDCSVASSSNAWMEEELTLRWCDEVPGQFTFTRGFTRSRHILPIK